MHAVASRYVVRWTTLCLLAIIAIPSIATTIDTLRTLPAAGVKGLRASAELTSTVPMQSLTAAEIAQRGLTNVSDALRHLAGLSLRDYGGAGGMKTVSVRGMGSAHTSISYDGIVMGDATTGSFDISRFSLEGLQQLGLVVGDNYAPLLTARAAASAAGVALLAFTEDSYRTLGVGQSRSRVHVEQGSFNRWNTAAQFTHAVSRTFRLQGFADYLFASNDYPYHLRNGRTWERAHRNNSQMNRLNAELNASFDLTPSDALDAKLYYYDNNHHLPGVVLYYNPTCNEKLLERDAFAQLRWLHRFDPTLTLQVVGKYDKNYKRYTDVNAKYPNGRWLERYDSREAYASAVLAYQPTSQRWRAGYAADVVRQTLESNQIINADVSRTSILQSFTAGLRLCEALRMDGRLLWSIHANHADGAISARDAQHLSPSLAVSWRVFRSETFYLRAFYKDIYRMPSFAETYQYHLGNAELKPETAHQLGGGFTFSKRMAAICPELRLTVDAYFNRVTDKIVSTPVNMFQWRTLNMSKVHARGIDATLLSHFVVAPRHELTLTGNYSYQWVHDRSASAADGQIAYLPQHTGAAALSYLNPWFTLAVNTTANSYTYATHNHAAGTRLPGHAEWGAMISHTFNLSHLRVDLRADMLNVFNRQYSIVSGYPMPGRAYRLALTCHF